MANIRILWRNVVTSTTVDVVEELSAENESVSFRFWYNRPRWSDRGNHPAYRAKEIYNFRGEKHSRDPRGYSTNKCTAHTHQRPKMPRRRSRFHAKNREIPFLSGPSKIIEI